MKGRQGFSLIELLVVIAILGILAIVAIPAYQTYAQKSRRTDAISTLLAIQLAQEKYRTTNATYGNLNQVWGGVTSTPEGHYTLSITGNTATTYTVTATAVGGQSSDNQNGTSCATLTLAYGNGTTTKSPSVCWMTS